MTTSFGDTCILDGAGIPQQADFQHIPDTAVHPGTAVPPLASYPVSISYRTLLLHSKSLTTVLPFFYIIIRNFFILQFEVKFGLKKIPVIRVDNELDKTVPFVPAKIETYLGFINYWIRPLSFLIKKLGAYRAIPHCNRFLRQMMKCYTEAARIYRFRMTTTQRPDYFVNPAFAKMWRADPHLLCVPSLHVAICIHTCTFYNDLFTTYADCFTPEECTKYTQELYRDAIAIIESVLYVKQHSVNCIPAALYMMTSITNGKFSIAQATRVIDDLFRNSTDISEENKTRIHAHISFMFEQLLLEGCNEEDWVIPVRKWLLAYKAPQS